MATSTQLSARPILPRLEELTAERPQAADDPDIQRRRIDDSRQLIEVMKYCVDEGGTD
ncbi:hypothetical protein [Streptomyces sp. NPDC059701]|uniref:hypothetical protein n=1 Tax=Streptomyces sp. NPDC059701 TaxID=3346914 RepID=UPI00369A0457